MFGSGYENCPEFGVLGGVIFKLDILSAIVPIHTSTINAPKKGAYKKDS
jgi:hypothetical protein